MTNVAVFQSGSSGASKIQFANADDTNLYSRAPGTIRTDASLQVANSLEVVGSLRMVWLAAPVRFTAVVCRAAQAALQKFISAMQKTRTCTQARLAPFARTRVCTWRTACLWALKMSTFWLVHPLVSAILSSQRRICPCAALSKIYTGPSTITVGIGSGFMFNDLQSAWNSLLGKLLLSPTYIMVREHG